jgi:hypothetical protein
MNYLNIAFDAEVGSSNLHVIKQETQSAVNTWNNAVRTKILQIVDPSAAEVTITTLCSAYTSDLLLKETQAVEAQRLPSGVFDIPRDRLVESMLQYYGEMPGFERRDSESSHIILVVNHQFARQRLRMVTQLGRVIGLPLILHPGSVMFPFSKNDEPNEIDVAATEILLESQRLGKNPEENKPFLSAANIPVDN